MSLTVISSPFNTLSSFGNAVNRLDALRGVITAALKSGEYDRAMEAAQGLPSAEAAEQLLRIAGYFDPRLDVQSDLKLKAVRLAAEAANTMPTESVKAIHLVYVAQWFLNLKNYDEAKPLLESAFIIAKRETNTNVKVWALAHIIDALMESQKGMLVFKRLVPMQDNVKKEVILKYLIDPTKASERVLAKVTDEMKNDAVYSLVIEDLSNQIEAKLGPIEVSNNNSVHDEKS